MALYSRPHGLFTHPLGNINFLCLTWPFISGLGLCRMAELAASISKVMFSMASVAFSSDRQAEGVDGKRS